MHLIHKGAGFGAPSRFYGAVTLQKGTDGDSDGGSGGNCSSAGSPGSCRSFPPVSEEPLARGSQREAGAQLFSARIGPEGADVIRLLGALLGGDDAPPQLGSNFPAGRCAGGGCWEEGLRAGTRKAANKEPQIEGPVLA
ncbi:unnamed protein product [Rangifer tarandus platyrhynchus]|uniref:Uncharacterized protein n=2 Tax=Rangifer tarandus platyrhynchus TaxID=3082113 RepID=A0ACB0FCX0_RANTA|nr:unnamed protein product [Rangifer tarandus platyrhynchus]CAI9710343.1 unnamed protein product [Rangifer tarandus platyrhynchus]